MPRATSGRLFEMFVNLDRVVFFNVFSLGKEEGQSHRKINFGEAYVPFRRMFAPTGFWRGPQSKVFQAVQHKIKKNDVLGLFWKNMKCYRSSMPKGDAIVCRNKAFAWYWLQIKRFLWIMKFDEEWTPKGNPKLSKIDASGALGRFVVILGGVWQRSIFHVFLCRPTVGQQSQQESMRWATFGAMMLFTLRRLIFRKYSSIVFWWEGRGGTSSRRWLWYQIQA